MSSGVDQLPRTLHLASPPIRDTIVSDGRSSLQYVLLPTQDPSQAESSFTDGSDVLFSLYNEKAAEYDQKLAENWREDAQGLMILSGLLSVTVATFLSQSYLTSQTNSQDVSAFYLSQIYQLQSSSSPNKSDIPLPPAPPKPAPVPHVAHLFWFPSLVLSLATAIFSTLVQEWVRRYLLLTQPRFSPYRRARIRACMAQEGSLFQIQRTMHTLNMFLHFSVFFFFAGIIAVTATGGTLIVVAVNLYIFVPLVLYIRYSLTPYFEPQSLHSTPFSGFILSLMAIPRMGSYLFRAMVRRGRFREVFRSYNTPVERGWLSLDSALLEVEKLAESRSQMLDVGAVSWLLNSLGRDQELEQFLAGIPGFYSSKRVEDPAQILRVLNTDRIPKAIVAFMDRSLSSELVTGVAEQKRIRVSLKAMLADPYLLERTFHHALFSLDSAIFKSFEFVLLADRCTNDDVPDICFLAKCVVAVAISQLDSDSFSDDRWSGIIQRGLNWSEAELSEHGRLRDNIKLRNLVQIARELHVAHPDYDDPSFRMIFHNTLSAVRQLKVESTSQDLRHEFCVLWNQLVTSMQDQRRDMALRSNAMRILSLTRALYIPLHEGTESRCFSFLTSADDLDTPQKTSSFPLCALSNHRIAPRGHPEEGTTVNHGTRRD